MDTSLLVALQDIVHKTSLVILCVILVMGIIATIKPTVFKRLLREFSERKYTVSACAFGVLLCGTIFIATEPSAKDPYVSNDTQDTISAVDLVPVPTTEPATQIEINEIEVNEIIPYPKEQREDSNLPTGQIHLTQAGKNGQMTRRYAVTYDNGKETTRALKSETISIPAIPEIITVGTQASSPGSHNNGGHGAKSGNSGRSIMPQIGLTCKNGQSNGSKESWIQICLYKN